MKNIVIIFARGEGNKINKNLLRIGAFRCLEWQIKAALSSNYTEKIYLSTNDDEIAQIGENYDIEIIRRNDPEIYSDFGESIIHAITNIDEENQGVPLTITILLGNTVMVEGKTIDECFEMLYHNDEADSVISCVKAEFDHPLRALKKGPDKYLESYFPELDNIPIDKHSYSEVYYYDQGVFCLKKDNLLWNMNLKGNNKMGPWWWLGRKSLPYVRDWITGRDTNSYYDIELSKWYVKNFKK